MRLLLIRHGQTPANVLGQLDTAHPGPGLTELGLQQASEIPDALGAQPIDALFASTLVRTQLTAAPLAQARGLQVEVRRGLHEVEAGDLESRSDREAVRIYLETVFAWGAGNLDVAMPGGPDGHDFFGRYNADLESIAGSGADVAAVVSHGAAIRVWVAAHAGNVPPMFAAENPLDNTGIVVVDGSFEDGWALTRWAGQPVGGRDLVDTTAEDPTGETLNEASDH
jgi:broad specificity phosphatase PhoE